MRDFRCTCGRLLAQVEDKPITIIIKCPRCKVLNHWNASSVRSDSQELQTETVNVSSKGKQPERKQCHL
ncbi:Com family DNA-binding transcriptional regulator [Acinetobacter sp. TR3]|uniref:Com family DNA-binding transcriptional regulator n=1 Tax=unclassified Acinetobacter TaxID=196816 RepID=UPI003FA4427F